MTTTANRPPMIVTLGLLSALSIVSLNMFLPSLNNIAREFDADYAVVNLSIAGYAAMAAVLQLAIGPASDRFGRRPVILAGLLVFMTASAGCILATDVAVFLLCRMLQAAIISGSSVAMAVVRDTREPTAAASVIGYMAMAWAVAPMLGPMFGGYLDENFGWRASFWAFLCLGAALFCLCWFDLRETNRRRSKTFADQFRTYPALVSSRRFWGYALCMAFSVGAFYAFLGGVPLVAVHVFHMPTATLGLSMGIITAGFVLGSFLSGRFVARTSLMTMILAGRTTACVGLAAGLVLLAAGVVHELTYFGACICVGIGNGLTMPSSNAGAMSVRPELAGSAAGLTGALTGAGGAVMSALTGVVLSPDNAAFALLGMMLLSSALAFVAALYVHRAERTVRPGVTA